MPKITIYFIRSGMIFFALSLVLAVIMAFSQSGFAEYSWTMWRPIFWHFLLVGWITQVIMGVSVWMFPRKRRGQSGGGENAAWIAFIGINTGLVLRALTEPFLSISYSSGFMGVLIVASAVLQVVGGAAYVIGIWPRVKGKRKRSRR